MNKTIRVLGFLFILSIFLMGVNGFAGKSIDKIKYPPLHDLVLPQIEKIEMSNGMTLYLLEDHELPVVNASVRLAAGGYLEPVDKIGLAEMVGTVMRTGGTEKMTGDEIDELLESIGATVETYVDNASGGAYMNILSDKVDTGLEVLAAILRTPRFDQEKIDIAKSSERTNIASRNDEPFTVCIREFKKLLYGADSPFARHTEYATIASISRDDMFSFHKQNITPENVMMAVWGDFNKAEMVEKINKYFGDWAKGSGKTPPLPEVKYDFSSSVNYIEKKDLTQSSILLGHIGGLTADPDYFALTIANMVLGGDGNGGRMFNEVRSRKGLAYSTTGQFTSNISYPGIFYNYVITKLESTGEAIKAVRHEIERMQTEPPTAEELKIAKDTYLNSFVFQFDSKNEIINRMMTYDYYGFPQDFLQTAKTKIEQLTANDILDVAKRRFKPDQMHLVVVGNQANFDEPLSNFGEVNEIDITIPSGEVEEEIAINEETLARGKELLTKALTKCGGIDNFKRIKSFSSKSTFTLVLPQGEIALETSSIAVLPDKSKDIMTTPMGEIISCRNGETGWVQQAGQIMDQPADQIADAKEEEFRNSIMMFQNSADLQVVFVKSSEFKGTPVEIVKVISPDGQKSFKLALDAKSFMPLAQMYFGETMMGPANLINTVSDYKEVNGVKIPHNIFIETDDGTKIGEVAIKSFKINPAIDESEFNKPQ